MQDQIEFADQWIVVLSGRHDWTASVTEDHRANSTTEQKDNALTGRAGLVYRTAAELAPYLSYSQSFMPVVGTNLEGEQYDPERGEQYEAGVKYQPPGLHSFITVALYHLTRQNVKTPDPENPNNQIQIGETQSRGVEIEAVTSLFPACDVTASYSFPDVVKTRSNAGDEGNRPRNVPEHTGTVWGNYTLQSGAFAGLGVAAGIRYKGDSYGNTANTLVIPGYTLLDGGVYYNIGGFRIGINGSNLLDKRYVASGYSSSSVFYGTARNVRASVQYQW